jgi:hypothetical protein
MPGAALDGAPALGGVEGIYGINALPLRWTGVGRPADVAHGGPARDQADRGHSIH